MSGFEIIEGDVTLRGTVSAGNSSSAPLAGGATFTGTAEEITHYAIVFVTVFASHASGTNGLSIEQSSDGTNWDFIDAFTVPAATGKSFSLNPAAKWFRVRYTNGATTQTAFRLQTVYKQVYAKPSSHKLAALLSDEEDAELVRAVLSARLVDGSGYVAIEATTDKRLLVSEAVTAPAGTTPVSRLVDGNVSSLATVEDVYVITNGKTLRIQRFSGGGEDSVSGGRVELYSREGSPAVDTLIDVGYVSGGNFQFDLFKNLVGNTSPSVNRKVVLKRINGGGSSMRIKGRWEGYEE